MGSSIRHVCVCESGISKTIAIVLWITPLTQLPHLPHHNSMEHEQSDNQDYIDSIRESETEQEWEDEELLDLARKKVAPKDDHSQSTDES